MKKEKKFRLEKVLKAKKIKRDVEQRKLAEHKKVLEQEQNQLNDIKRTEQEFLTDLKEKRMRRAKGRELQSQNSYSRQVQMYLKQQAESVQVAENQVHKQRNRLLDVTREKEMLDKLREKSAEEYQRHQDSFEQKQIDEFSQFEPYRKLRK